MGIKDEQTHMENWSRADGLLDLTPVSRCSFYTTTSGVEGATCKDQYAGSFLAHHPSYKPNHATIKDRDDKLRANRGIQRILATSILTLALVTGSVLVAPMDSASASSTTSNIQPTKSCWLLCR